MNSTSKTQKHLLTILVEDYFHVGAFENLIQQRNWSNFEPRYEQNTIKTLDLLDEYGTKATFFVLGWIAEQNPSLIREIVARGHEVASRGYYHRSLKNLTDEEFREDLKRTNRAIEDACGQKVLGYRAAEKLAFADNDWILNVLADEGFAYDASFLPNVKTAKPKRFAHQVHVEGKAIWEFPYATHDLGLGLLPISGGNYFRQIPYTLMRHAVRNWTQIHDEPFIFYFHVWELDPEQPRISAASNYNRIRHYRKLDKMEWILKENLELYDCIGVAEYLGMKEVHVQSPKPKAQSAIKPKKSAIRNPQSAISVVIPCYNETDALPYLANTLRAVETGLIDTLSTTLAAFINWGQANWALSPNGTLLFAALLILWVSGFLSALIDNIPYVAVTIPIIASLVTRMSGDTEILWWALSLGACLGGNGTLIGASANVSVVGLAEKAKEPITFGQFARFGSQVAIITLVISSAFIVGHIYLGPKATPLGALAIFGGAFVLRLAVVRSSRGSPKP